MLMINNDNLKMRKKESEMILLYELFQIISDD